MAEQEYYYALGRRKTAVATVKLYFRKGKMTLNEKDIQEIYSDKVSYAELVEPLKISEIDPKDVNIVARSTGGGKFAQLDAIKLALARAIIKKFPENKKALKNAGLLTRDPRMVERKKPGLRKARKAEQYSKR